VLTHFSYPELKHQITVYSKDFENEKSLQENPVKVNYLGMDDLIKGFKSRVTSEAYLVDKQAFMMFAVK